MVISIVVSYFVYNKLWSDIEVVASSNYEIFLLYDITGISAYFKKLQLIKRSMELAIRDKKDRKSAVNNLVHYS